MQLQRLKPHLQVVAHSPDQVELRSGVFNYKSHVIIDHHRSGKLFALLQDLTGQYSLRDLARKHRLPYSQVQELFQHLQDIQVIESGPVSALDYYLQQADPAFAQLPKAQQLAKPILLMGSSTLTQAIAAILLPVLAPTQLTCLPEDDPLWQLLNRRDLTWLHDGLQQAKILEQFSAWRDYFIVLALDSMDPCLGLQLGRIAHFLQIPWLHSAVDGPCLLIGPTFATHGGPCYECFELRMNMNLRNQASYQRYKTALLQQQINITQHLSPVLAQLFAAHTAIAALNYCLTAHDFTVGKLFAIYLPTMEMSFNPVLQVGLCGTCGSALRNEPQLYGDMSAILGSVH